MREKKLIVITQLHENEKRQFKIRKFTFKMIEKPLTDNYELMFELKVS